MSRRAVDQRERSPNRDGINRQDTRREYSSSHRGSQYKRGYGLHQPAHGNGNNPTYASGRDSSHGSRNSNSHRGPNIRMRSSDTKELAEKLLDVPTHVTIPTLGRTILNSAPITPSGKSGRLFSVKVNHFEVQSLPGIPVYQYSLEFKLPTTCQRHGMDKVSVYTQGRAFIKGSQDMLFGKFFVFDGVSRGWSIDKLLDLGTTRTALIDLDENFQIETSIRAEKMLNFGKLVAYLRTGVAGTATTDKDISEVLQYLGALFRQGPASQAEYFTRPNSNAYFNRTINGLSMPLESTGKVLEAIRGIFQTVSIGFGGRLCLNVDTCCAAFYTPDMSMIRVAQAFAGLRYDQDLSQHYDQFVGAGCARLVGMFFYVRHLDAIKNSKHMRIMRISDVDAMNLRFDMIINASTDEKKVISVYEYFKERYNIMLKHPRLPLLMTRAGAFPMELCYSAPGERYGEALQGKETADFIRFATSPAFVRESHIRENVQRLQWHGQEVIGRAGISVATKLLETPAHKLDVPIPTYASGSSDRSAPSSGAWNLRGKRLLLPKTFKAWGLCYFPDRHEMSDNELQAFCDTFKAGCAGLGLNVPSGRPAFLKANSNGNIEHIVREIFEKTGNTFKVKPHLLIFIIHETTDPAMYRAIKSVTEVRLGVASQVLVAEKFRNSRGIQQYVANVALKANAKLGGVNSVVAGDPLLGRVKVMQVGSDVSHPSPSERRKLPPPPSFAAMTASYDRDCASFTAVSTAQPAGIEFVQAQGAMFKELLNRFKHKAASFPDLVLLWRDGLSDSMISEFLNTEMIAFKDVRRELGASFKIVAVNCVKRTHTRFFPLTKSEGDRLGNLPPGTCIEFGKENDVFIITAAALQGTIAPVRYTTVLNEAHLSTDDLKRLVVNACFAYQKATRSVSLHPAVFYAHQVAEKARSRLTRDEYGQVKLPDTHPDLHYTMFWQ